MTDQEIEAMREEVGWSQNVEWPYWHLCAGPDDSPLYWAEIAEEERARRVGLH